MLLPVRLYSRTRAWAGWLEGLALGAPLFFRQQQGISTWSPQWCISLLPGQLRATEQDSLRPRWSCRLRGAQPQESHGLTSTVFCWSRES